MSFVAAPVSKLLLLGLVGTSVIAGLTGRQYLFNVPISPHLTRDHQLWRLLSCHLAFANSAELFVAALLLFYVSLPVERNLGSLKYASILVVTTALSTLLSLLLLLLPLGVAVLPAGPFAVLATVLHLYSRLVPTTYSWKLFSLTLTSRLALYLLAAQLFSAEPPTTLYLGAIGVCSSALVSADFLSLKSYRLSPLIVRLGLIATAWIGSTPIPRRSTVASFGEANPSTTSMAFPSAFVRSATASALQAQTARTGAARRVVAVPRVPAPGLVNQWVEGIGGPPTAAPSVEQIASLTAMFPDRSREDIVTTLQRSNLDVSRAAETLLSGA